ncbi:MAG: DUF2283 domain-containing protein [Anaerolineae bacterium]|nr:DUF2283 domain-containing protein [Anaerolineae bacterium]
MAEMTNFFYDREGDVFYLSIGKPQEAVSKEIGEDVLLRVHPLTGEIVGITVLNFVSRFSDLAHPQALPLYTEFRVKEKTFA